MIKGKSIYIKPETDTVYGNGNTEISIVRPGGEMNEINAADFGLSADSCDNTAAMQSALDYCAENSGTALRVEKGVYYFRNKSPLTIKNAENVIIDGGGSEFIFSEFFEAGRFFGIEKCRRVTVCNMIFDWDWDKMRLADIVRISDIGDFGVDLEFTELPAAPDEFVFGGMNQCDPETYAPGCENGREFSPWRVSYTDAVKISDKILRINGLKLDGANIGDTFILRRVLYGTHATAFRDSSNMTLENLTVYSAPGMSYSISGSDHFQVLGCKIMIRPESGRCVSSTADGLYIGNGGGFSRVENCDFSRMGDDALNYHTTTGRLFKRISDREFLTYRFLEPKIGEEYEFKKPDFADTGFKAVAEECELMPYERLDDRQYRVKFDRPLPPDFGNNYIYMQASAENGSYVVRNNYFHENRARGALLGTKNGLFENNTLFHSQGAAIQMSVDVQNGWSEGNGVENVVVRNNKFIDCNAAEWKGGVIDMKCGCYSDITDVPVIKNITVEGNSFVNTYGYAVTVASADRVTVKGNSFSNPNGRKCNKDYRAGIHIEKSEMIWVSDNIWEKSDYVKNPAYIKLEESDREKFVIIENNRIAE